MRNKCPVSDVMMLIFMKLQVDRGASVANLMSYLKKNFIVPSVLTFAYKIQKIRKLCPNSWDEIFRCSSKESYAFDEEVKNRYFRGQITSDSSQAKMRAEAFTFFIIPPLATGGMDAQVDWHFPKTPPTVDP